MNKSILFLVIVIIAIGAAVYMWWPNVHLNVPEENIASQGKLMSIENYITQNISALSPVKEQLGGKFYVTSITAADGKGVVSYEDGHNAYTADFTYTSSDQTGHTITSFVIR
ncbi:hypothetical protein KW796_00710 [Candidatus Parcubacteria bacterium]|nr:hypothetical protein [Candidatus Parcubacteria bacterium]